MHNRHWLTSDAQQRRLFAALTTRSRLRARQRRVMWACVLMLPVCVVLLSACTTPPPEPCETLPLPKPPALSEPLPSQSYSTQWRQLVESLRQKLTGTPTTP